MGNAWDRAMVGAAAVCGTFDLCAWLRTRPRAEVRGRFDLGMAGSETGRIICGYASIRGRSDHMDDTFSIIVDHKDPSVDGLFAVFGGQDGSNAAQYLSVTLLKNLVKHPTLLTHTKSAIEATYLKTYRDFCKVEPSNTVGSTACSAVLIESDLFVAHVGNSKGVMSMSGNAVPLSHIHDPDRAGGRLSTTWNEYKWGLAGILPPSRAFGFKGLKRYVIARPEIQQVTITKDTEFFILATGGLWAVMSLQEAVSMVKSVYNPEEAAWTLLYDAYERGAVANLTCIVVRLFSSRRRFMW